MPSNFCSECGGRLKPQAKFCSTCGTAVAEPSDSEPSRTPSPQPSTASHTRLGPEQVGEIMGQAAVELLQKDARALGPLQDGVDRLLRAAQVVVDDDIIKGAQEAIEKLEALAPTNHYANLAMIGLAPYKLAIEADDYFRHRWYAPDEQVPRSTMARDHAGALAIICTDGILGLLAKYTQLDEEMIFRTEKHPALWRWLEDKLLYRLWVAIRLNHTQLPERDGRMVVEGLLGLLGKQRYEKLMADVDRFMSVIKVERPKKRFGLF